ncbi:MAG: FMN-binding protein [Bacteroidota bacterium]
MAIIDINPGKQVRDRWDRRLAIFAIATIILAWMAGALINHRVPPDCRTVLPEAQLCRPRGEFYEGVILNSDQTETVVGWAAISEANGYAGPVQVMLGIDPAGKVTGIDVLSHTETPSFYEKVANTDFFEQFVGKQSNAPFVLGNDLDGVTRATFTSRAISDAVREAGSLLAEEKTSLTVVREPQSIKFGLPEIVLILLYAVGFVAHRGGFRYKTIVRWAMMLTGMIVLGFTFNLPFTIAHFNSLLIGFWPDWHTDLYWFLLVGGILFVVTVDNKNPYCQWFCPFGAAQECLGAIGGAKLYHPGKYRYLLKNVQRFLAWSAIILGVLFRNPGFSSYEIFGALFSFNAATLQWVVLIVILLLSLFVKRPWCEFLCPIDPIIDLIHAIQRWIQEALRKWNKKPNPAAES